MESTRPIRALIRGLDALTVLNLRNGATVSEVAQEIRLPRTTTYRILETLSHAGFVYRDATDDRYRLTIMVRGLSDGYDDEAWITQIARLYGDQCVSVKDGFILLVERPPRRRIPGSAPHNAAIRRTANNMPTRVGKPDMCSIGNRSRCTGVRKAIGVRALFFRRQIN